MDIHVFYSINTDLQEKGQFETLDYIYLYIPTHILLIRSIKNTELQNTLKSNINKSYDDV